MCNGLNQTPCGDLYAPPSRNNLSLLAIIELVIMFAVAILCALDLFDFFDHGGSLKTITGILTLIDDIIIVAAICYIIYGLFCAFTSYQMKIGILLFVVGGILAMVVLILQIIYNTDNSILYKIFLFILFLYLTWILWNQAARL